MDRRAFLKWIGVGGLASSLPVAIAACSNIATPPQPNRDSLSSARSQTNGYITVGTVKGLEKTGRLRKKASGNSVLVVQDPNIPNTLHAFEPICTHQGCEVDWRKREKNIFCSCHGSTFNSDGAVIRGPASRPLKSYPVKIEGESILVKVS